MRKWLLGSCGVLCLLAVGCGPEVVEEAPACLSVTEPAGGVGLTTSLPSKVSLLFKVDTCGGEPVSGLDATHFTLTEDGRAVSAFESQVRVQPKGERFVMDSLVLLDLSGSVLRSGDFDALAAAAKRYVSAVLEGDSQRVAVMTFDGRASPQLVVDFTGDAATVLAGLDGLSAPECRANVDCAGLPDRRTCAGWRCVDDSTNLNGALVAGLATLEGRLALKDVPWRDAALVLFTDGTDQAARLLPAAALEAVRSSRAHVFTVGLGGEVDEVALRAYGRDGYFPVARAAELDAAFSSIAARVNGLANRFYLLEYCSPKRSGKHVLKVLATVPRDQQPPLIGGLSREFDADGFGSGCEL
ncbi:MAG: VWA domain-containing protein [Myxococcota bacterium]